jgi:thiamine-monophosphate kinase
VAALIARYRLPQPRVAFGRALLGIASAAIDVSDGLLADLGHLADVSNMRIDIDAARIPRSRALRDLWGPGEPALVRAATAGDDYEMRSPHGLRIAPAYLPPPSAQERASARSAW